ncbi:ComEC/Rec2 family competence protein, partial [Anaerovibrio sp.]|uniref:ComEC/Rec2 family competence protein n=1 Tax=Anaerovibrio sp. TaxID=1872532 RepID=UPI003F1500BB
MGQHPKEFLVFLLAVLCAGIFLGHSWQEGADYAAYIRAGAWAGLCLAAIAVCRGHRLSWLAVGACVFLLGIGRYYAVAVPPENDIGRLAGQRVKLEGRLAGAPESTVDEAGGLHVRYEVECEKLAGRDSVGGRLMVYANENSLHGREIMAQIPVKRQAGEEKADWELAGRELLGRSGDRLAVSGTVRALHDYGNPGRLNREMSLAARGIHGRLTADKYSLELMSEDGDRLARLSERIRNAYREYMERAMPKQDAAAVFAMLFGGYQGIRPELLEAFTVTGIVHILSVSGSHITLMAGTAGIVGRLLHLPDRVTAGMGVATILFYGLLAGAIPPVIRSALMGILTLLALTLGREKDARHLLSIVALGLLLYSPPLLYDISFQLSFGATAGLLYIAPAVREWLRKRLPVFVADSLAVTLGAQLSVLPLLAWYFNAVSISSLLANLVIAPAVEWIIVIGLLAGMAGSLLPLAGHLVFMAASLLLGLVYELSRLTAALPFSQVYVPSPGFCSSTVYYMALGWLIAPAGKRAALADRIKGSALWKKCALGIVFPMGRKKYLPVLFVVLAVLLLWAGYRSFFAADRLQVHFID